MGFFDDLIDNVGDSLAQTAVSYVNDTTGTDLGSAVGALFGFGQTTPGQNLQNLQAQLPGKFAGDPVGLGILQADMGRQMNLITAIGSDLTALQNSVEQLAGEDRQHSKYAGANQATGALERPGTASMSRR